MEPLQIEPHHLQEVIQILTTHLPGVEIWAYGSRALGTAERYSDLDLVAYNPVNPDQRIHSKALIETREAFSESNIPFFIQLFDWANIPEEFKPNILRDKKILLQLQPTTHS